MKLSVIIPNYNSAKTILNTLQSIYSQPYPIGEVLVVDDASTDESLSLVEKNYPGVKIFKNKKNNGAGFTRNVGIANASGEFLLFVDSDVVVRKETIPALLQHGGSADIVYPKIVYENGMSMYPNTKKDEEYLLISPIFLISRGALKKLDGSFFDSGYTGYCEDVDFFLKCRLFGLTCRYVPEVLAIHVVNKPKNREGRYYSEVVSSIYGAIKFFGYKNLSQLDHSFKASNICKLAVIGIFNFKLFDAQTKNFNKAGSTLYKIKYMLTQKERISDKGGLYLFALTIKGFFVALWRIPKALEARRALKMALKAPTRGHF